MNKDKIREFVIEKNEKLSGLASEISPLFDPKTIHDFRIAFKYLRSFFRLLRTHYPDSGLKFPARLKDLFSIAGTIRELQLELEYAQSQYPEIELYINDLRHSIEGNQKIWNRTFSNRVFEHFTRHLKRYRYEDIPEAILNNFLNSKIVAIDHYVAGSDTTNEQIHDVRKEAKDILYTSNAFEKKRLYSSEKKKFISLKQLHRVAEKIGDYNDDRQHIASLKQYASNTKVKADKKSISAITKLQTPGLEKIKTNILQQIKKLFLKKSSKPDQL